MQGAAVHLVVVEYVAGASYVLGCFSKEDAAEQACAEAQRLMGSHHHRCMVHIGTETFLLDKPLRPDQIPDLVTPHNPTPV